MCSAEDTRTRGVPSMVSIGSSFYLRTIECLLHGPNQVTGRRISTSFVLHLRAVVVFAGERHEVALPTQHQQGEAVWYDGF